MIKSTYTTRIHGMDSLRAVMMLLGLVIHSAIMYQSKDLGNDWPLKDASNHWFFTWLSDFIHLFRMPAFFMVAGFFGALLFYHRSPLKMITNRIRRVFLPFLVFLVLLWPTFIYGFVYCQDAFNASGGSLTHFSKPAFIQYFIPRTTFHLWFLYYLTLITIVFFLFGVMLKKCNGLTKTILHAYQWLLQQPFLRLLFFSGAILLVLYIFGMVWPETSVSFIPRISTFSFYAIFYGFGWLLFLRKSDLNQLNAYAWPFTLLATGMFSILFFYEPPVSTTVLQIINSLIAWLFVFGISGLFLKYGNSPTKRMRYLSDASYWFYLIHLPFALILSGMIASWEINAFLKFTFVLIVTFLICLISYHFLVRNTFIGQFLNGQKHPRKP